MTGKSENYHAALTECYQNAYLNQFSFFPLPLLIQIESFQEQYSQLEYNPIYVYPNPGCKYIV